MSGQEESKSEGGLPQPGRDAGGFNEAPVLDATNKMDPKQGMASFPPVEGGISQPLAASPPGYPPAPPMHRNDQQVTTANATAVTPDSRQLVPPELMSPPYAAIRRGEMSPAHGPAMLSVSPSKRSGRSGELHLFQFMGY